MVHYATIDNWGRGEGRLSSLPDPTQSTVPCSPDPWGEGCHPSAGQLIAFWWVPFALLRGESASLCAHKCGICQEPHSPQDPHKRAAWAVSWELGHQLLGCFKPGRTERSHIRGGGWKLQEAAGPRPGACSGTCHGQEWLLAPTWPLHRQRLPLFLSLCLSFLVVKTFVNQYSIFYQYHI